MKAVRFSEYGDVDVLQVAEVDTPEPGAGEVRVRVVAAGINIGEAKIRRGELAEVFPAHFPEGQGSDFAGIVDTAGEGVDRWRRGDEVIGRTARQSHAEYVVVPATDVIRKPAAVEWEQAGAIFVAGTAAWAAVDAVAPQQGEVVLVSAAAGGVGVWASQLVQRRGARVIGTASEESFDFLRSIGVQPVAYGGGLVDRIQAIAPLGVDACIDTHGDGYVEAALELGIAPKRVNTLVDFAAVEAHGVQAEGTDAAASSETLTQLAQLLADRAVQVPLSAIYDLDEVRDAFTELERGHTRGKIVLGMNPIPHKNTSHKGAPQKV